MISYNRTYYIYNISASADVASIGGKNCTAICFCSFRELVM